MSTITYNRDAASIDAKTLTQESDSRTLIVTSGTPSHSADQPFTIELKRKLPAFASLQPGANVPVRRFMLNVKRHVTVFSGTELEQLVPVIAKVEMSIPVGVPDSEIDDRLHDVIGLLGNATVQEAVKLGIVQE